MVDYKVKDEELENQTIDENGNNNELDTVNDENNDIDKVDENIGDENEEEIIDNNKEIRNFDLGLNNKLGYNIWDTIVRGV